jgi:tetraacyldisaccharide 4'-kinase
MSRAVKRLDSYWDTRNWLSALLMPLAGLYCLAIRLRVLAYRSGLLISRGLPVPVIVVGNISVGGTGKTPLVSWLVRHLRDQGRRPGILIRGYGGSATDWPRRVRPGADPREVGDEAVVLARGTGCPVMAGPDRLESARVLVERLDCDVLVSDDGLQHYALNRDIEIAVVDGERRFGNGRCLPAGPLREPVARLQQADLVIVNGNPGAGELGMDLLADRAVNLADPLTVRPLESFRGQEVAAMAGIGNPGRFFRMLRQWGLAISEHAYPDHYPYRPEDLSGFGDRPVLMTEKDAVKCEAFAGPDSWYVPVEARPDRNWVRRLDRLMTGLNDDGQEIAGHTGMPCVQGQAAFRQEGLGADLPRRQVGLPDSGRDPGHAGGRGQATRGG